MKEKIMQFWGRSISIANEIDLWSIHLRLLQMASDNTIHIPSFMKIRSGIQVILRILPIQSESL
jgi:hypothetical protein